MGLIRLTYSVPRESHPLHPALVHFPLAFIFSAQVLDITYGLTVHPSTAKYVASAYDLKPYLGDLARLGNLFTILGLLSAVPSVSSGIWELLKMLNRQAYTDKIKRSNGSAKALAQQTHPKVTTALIHAATMDLVVLGMAYNWWTRSGNSMKAPSEINVLVSALTAPLFGLSGYLGAHLVYNYGVGVSATAVWPKKEQ
jgi:uncharacterized membrane protein